MTALCKQFFVYALPCNVPLAVIVNGVRQAIVHHMHFLFQVAKKRSETFATNYPGMHIAFQNFRWGRDFALAL